MAKTGWQVDKFGGSSLADPQCFRRVADILLRDQASDKGRAVVVSAMGGMTDALLRLVVEAELSADSIDPGIAAISDRYQAAVRELLGSPDKVEGLLALFDADLRDVSDVLNAISLVRSAADRSRDLESLEAPDFTLPDIEGKLHSLSDYRGKKVFLATWASW